MLPLSVKLRALQSAEDDAANAADQASWLRRGAGVVGHGSDDVVGTGVPVHVSGSRARLAPEELEQAVFLCVLEALQNAAKHAGLRS